MIETALLILEDGTQFAGKAIGASGITIGEIVFNTSMTGYQEILTDPSYFYQIIIFTYPHIGNVGINNKDNESFCIQASGLIIKNLSIIASNFRSELTLNKYLIQQNIVGIADIDTRKLTCLIREKGSQNGCIVTSNYFSGKINDFLCKIRSFPNLNKIDLIQKVTTKKKYCWVHGNNNLKYKSYRILNKTLFSNIVVFDFGIKRSIMCILARYCYCLIIVPAKTTADTVLSMNPNGIFLSNGPGNPALYNYAINTVKKLLETNIPIFGICLGYQLLALASGAKTIKMKFGHHGSNHPVKDLDNDKIITTVQNHNFAVDKNTLPKSLRITHVSLFDNSLQGIHRIDKPAFGFQGHPEASPGPHDANLLFGHFIKLINDYSINNKIIENFKCQNVLI